MHFLEADSAVLKALSNGDQPDSLLNLSYALISNPEMQQKVASIKIFVQIAKFFKQLSEDNKYVAPFFLHEDR